MKRPRAALFGFVLAGFALYLYAPLPAPAVAPARAGDCVLLRLWTNGFHIDMGVPAEALPETHPLRRLYPRAHSFLIGWGERSFYYSDGTDLWLGLDAIVPPSPAVMHVADDADRAFGYLGPSDEAALAISHEGATRLAAFLTQALALGDGGEVLIDRPGKVIGHSQFLKARGDFHLFNVCNHWMARALRAAGLNVNARTAWLGSWLIADARKAAPSMCPAAP